MTLFSSQMALSLTSPTLFLLKNPIKTLTLNPPLFSSPISSPSFSFSIVTNPRFSSTRIFSTFSGDPDPLSSKPPSTSGETPSQRSSAESVDAVPGGIVDEWGEKSGPEPEAASYTKLSETDPPKDDDEWGGWNGSAVGAVEEQEDDDKVVELKRCLVDSLYGTNFGFTAAAEVRAEVSELVNKLEAANPTPAPMEAAGLLDGKWVLVYTAFSELLPLLAIGTTPLLKVENICQVIDCSNLTIDNSTTLSSPFATFSFSALAKFEVQTPSRVQVQFKEGSFQPPEIKSSVDLPNNVDVFGQKINLFPVQQAFNPLLESVTSLSRAISGQPPLKVPIPGDRSKSWLLTTYLDNDFRISRGDGGLFVLVKEGSPLLVQ